jgi:hypothetical protein
MLVLPLEYRPRGDQPVLVVLLLFVPPHPGHGLQVCCEIPVNFIQYQSAFSDQIQSRTACLRAEQEDPDVRVDPIDPDVRGPFARTFIRRFANKATKNIWSEQSECTALRYCRQNVVSTITAFLFSPLSP